MTLTLSGKYLCKSNKLYTLLKLIDLDLMNLFILIIWKHQHYLQWTPYNQHFLFKKFAPFIQILFKAYKSKRKQMIKFYTLPKFRMLVKIEYFIFNILLKLFQKCGKMDACSPPVRSLMSDIVPWFDLLSCYYM